MGGVRIQSLAYLGFETPAVAEWPAFATEIYGFQLGEGAREDSVYLRMDSRHHRLALHPGAEDGLAYIGWELGDADAFAQAREALAAAGFAITEASEAELDDRAVSAMFHLADPAGFRHEFAYGQHFSRGTFQPGRPSQGFLAEEEGVGHVVLVAELTAEYRGFLTGVLGLVPYADFPVKVPGTGATGHALFLRCNDRTHCLAVLGMPGMKGLQHVAVEANCLDDVGIAYDRVQQRGVPIAATLGSHTIEACVSFYARTPSGFDLEFVHGGVKVTHNTIIGKPVKTDVWGHKPGNAGMPTTIKTINKS